MHVEAVYGLSESLDAPIMSALRLLANAIKKAFAADGIQIRQNNEAAAGQDVFHLHFHIIPRFDEDAFDDHPYEKLPLNVRRDLAIRLKAALNFI
jgi:histidine triad (HIT) family protein